MTGAISVAVSVATSSSGAGVFEVVVLVSSTSAKLGPSSFGDVAFGAAGSGRATGLVGRRSTAEVTLFHASSASAQHEREA